MNQTVNEIQQAFRQLRLSETAEKIPDFLRQAEQKSWTYLELIEELTTYELRQRENKSMERRLKWANFPYHKTLSEFHRYKQATIRTVKRVKLA